MVRVRPLLGAFVLLLATGCGRAARAPAGAAGIPVVAAENFYGELAGQVCGGRCAVTSILRNPAADPHTYESSVADAAAVANARLVIENGMGYDAFVDHLLAASPDKARLVINVQALTGHGSGDNPHLWYDPGTMPAVAKAVADDLAGIDPAHAADYRAAAERFDASLQPLMAEIAKIRATYPGAPVAATEPVFGYMERALGLDDLMPASFQRAIEDGNDPSAQDAAAAEQLLNQRRVRLLIYNLQTETPVTTRMRELAATDGIPTVGVTETEPAGTTYAGWMLDQLVQVERALAGGRG
jgi:zinc/manganese transport system substrate-binding protein